MYRFFLLIFLTGITVISSAATTVLKGNTVTPMQLKNDSGKITVRNFDKQKMAAYSKQSDFIYKDETAPDMSLWTRFWKWLWSWLDGRTKNMSKSKYNFNYLKYLAAAGAVCLLVFLVVKAAGFDLKIFTRKSKSVEIPYSESLDNIHEINFNDELTKAIGTGNYRLAVRLSYLSALKKLNDKNLIDWQPDKTNRTYISEIQDPHKKHLFGLLTTQFEYVWYGEFFIDEENFHTIKTGFDQFNLETS